MPAIYEAYAIYAECTGDDLGTKEMEEGMPNRVFNKVEAHREMPSILQMVPMANESALNVEFTISTACRF